MTTQATYDYDVIIVGGRVAGSTLAARLGKVGVRTLLLERAEFPSLPAVSSPIIYAGTMAMLDEIGADENAYAHNTPRLRHMGSVSSLFSGKIRLPEYKGRDYAYAIDRARFDAALWDTAMTYESVEGRQGFSVTDLTFDDDGRVTGIVGKPKGGESETLTARLVVGADGRFGIVSRKVNAQETDIHDTHPTSIYYAYWQNVTPFDEEGAASVAYEGSRAGHGYLSMDSADGQTVIAVEGRADDLQPTADERAEDFYMRMLKQQPELWTRLLNAERVTSVRGMKHIGNSYKQAGGAGWALVGDAYHQKDPLDGQGIWNAVITSKALTRSIAKWLNGDWSWQHALDEYDDVARVKTYPMYKALQTRIRASFYTEGDLPVPPQMMHTVSRWMLEDPAFNQLMGKMLTRELPPDMITLLAPPTILGALAKGPVRDFTERVKKRLPFIS